MAKKFKYLDPVIPGMLALQVIGSTSPFCRVPKSYLEDQKKRQTLNPIDIIDEDTRLVVHSSKPSRIGKKVKMSYRVY